MGNVQLQFEAAANGWSHEEMAVALVVALRGPAGPAVTDSAYRPTKQL